MAAHELDGEAVVVTRHRDGTAYDDAVAATLSELGAAPELRRGGPGPALFADVADGTAVALATSAGGADAGVVARPLAPSRSVEFAVLWRDAEPEPALGAFIDAAARVAPARPALRAVA